MPKFEIETIKRIYDERFPDMYYEIGTDAETGLNVEIRVVSIEDNRPIVHNRVAFDPDMIDPLTSILDTFRKV